MNYRWALVGIVAALVGCRVPVSHNLPPAEMLMHPGPGVDGPGPGVMTLGTAAPIPVQSSQIAFVSPEGMVVAWDVAVPGQFDSEPLVVPGRYNFPQGALYRLKLTNVPGRPGVELYPTLEVAPTLPRTEAYLAHNAIPFQLTDEDFDQVLSGNFVTKVIYLPDAEFQELALAGVETLVSTRLDPGVDPIVEADRRGAILAVIRIGNKDLQVPGAEAAGLGLAGMGPGGMGMGPSGVMPAGCTMPAGCGMPSLSGAAAGVPPGFVAGMTAPQYGMPISGTPIGLPGPPHIPLGGPAGLQKHVMRNTTFTHIPKPVERLGIIVKQTPGLTYPKPPHHAYIHERVVSRPWIFNQPLSDRHQQVGEPCEQPCP